MREPEKRRIQSNMSQKMDNGNQYGSVLQGKGKVIPVQAVEALRVVRG
jgi:hypothetical protein